MDLGAVRGAVVAVERTAGQVGGEEGLQALLRELPELSVVGGEVMDQRVLVGPVTDDGEVIGLQLQTTQAQVTADSPGRPDEVGPEPQQRTGITLAQPRDPDLPRTCHPGQVGAPSILVIDEPTGPSEAVVSHLRSLGAEVSHLRLPGSEESLRTAPEFAIVPTAILDAICDWMGDQTVNGTIGDEARDSVGRPVELAWREGAVIETVLRLAGHGHVGVLTEPVATAESAPAPNSTTLVLLNPGSETHVGPGRAWVELARDLALGGRRTIRIDFLGWGESPDAGRAPGHPYDACCEQDTVAIVNDLRDAGFERVTICGLCAAPWIVLRVASVAGAAGVIALNPQMYWKRGDPVEIDWDVIRARRAAEIRRIERGARFGLWSVIDALGQRSPSARWLDELSSIGIPVHIVFAENDDGLIYLRGRLRRLRGRLRRRLSRVLRRGHVSVRELPGVDHPMHRTWMRPHVVQALSEALQDIDAHR